MHGTASIHALVMQGGHSTARILCDAALIPSPGRYVVAHEARSAAILATALFMAGDFPGGFLAAAPIPPEWRPGSQLHIRGPLGRGFVLPPEARRVALSAVGVDATRLLPLAEAAFRQNAAVALVSDDPPADLPLQLEAHPVEALGDVCSWSDYTAFDVQQEAVGDLVKRLNELRRTIALAPSEIRVRGPVPCGGLAECGVCSIRTSGGFQLACADGPVFDLQLLLGRS